MDKSSNEEKKYGVQRKTIAALGDLKNVLESSTVLIKLKDLADKELQTTLLSILDLPEDHPNWAHNVATLIGQARVHRTYAELYTIKEK